LTLFLTAEHPALAAKCAEVLGLFDVTWPTHASIAVHVAVGGDVASAATTQAETPLFLEARRMRVTYHNGELFAACTSGATAHFTPTLNRWQLTIPDPEAEERVDLEDLFSLVLTTGWRRLGWTPLHAGAVCKGNCCALLCAPSGGGKSTLTAALLRRGWSALGDDKLLLRVADWGKPALLALVHRLNLDPGAQRWFPDLGDLTQQPAYSVWTPKRRVAIDAHWPGQSARTGQPTHLLALQRNNQMDGLYITPMAPPDLLAALLHQLVIPNERNTARQLLATAAVTARQLQGYSVEIGHDAYFDDTGLARLEEFLLCTEVVP
jgi:hypothetical protein